MEDGDNEVEKEWCLQVNKISSKIVNAITALTGRENEIKEQAEVIQKVIHDKIEEIGRQLSAKLTTITDIKLRVLSSQKRGAEMSLKQLKDCKEFLQWSLKTDHQQVLLSKKEEMENTGHLIMANMIKGINIKEYIPVEKADINIQWDRELIGDIVYTTALQVKKIDCHKITCEKETVSFPLSFELPDSSFVNLPLSLITCSVVSKVSTDKTSTDAIITSTNQPGVYRVHCSPVMNGPHQLNVQVNNVQLERTSLVIPFNPYLAENTSMHSLHGFCRPYGIAASDDGHIIVTTINDNGVTILDKEKNKRVASAVSFYCPRGVVITPDNCILVTDNHKIQKLTMEGKLISSIGQRGSKPLEFNQPAGIAISPTTGQIYVVDEGNHRVQVLNPDFTFSHSFGDEGSAEGQFKCPKFITFDNRRLVYVSDSSNNRVQVFTSEGKFVSQFGGCGYGCGAGQIDFPAGIVINNDLLYVVEPSNQRVSVFTTDGQFVSSFKVTKYYDYYYGDIAFDNEGCLYICLNDRIIVY